MAQARITIFTNFTPDTTNGVFYFPKDITLGLGATSFNIYLYKQMLADNPKNYITLEATTFNIYENFIDIAKFTKPSGNSDFTLWESTYVVIEDGIERYVYYFVDNITRLPQGYRLFIRKDNWANYIGNCKLSNIKVHRTNLVLNDDPYTLYIADEVSRLPQDTARTGTGRKTQLLTFNNDLIASITDLRIYASINYTTKQTTSEVNDETHLFKFTPLDYVKSYRTGATSVTPLEFSYILSYISSIYEYQKSTGSNPRATVNKIWIYTDLPSSNDSQETFIGSGKVLSIGTATAPNYITGARVAVSDYSYTQTIVNQGAADTVNAIPPNNAQDAVYIPNNIGRDIYVGTKYDAIKLPHFVGSYNVEFNIIVSNEELQFRIYAGTEIKDVTQSFEYNFVSNTASLTQQERQVKALSIISSTVGGVAQIASGGITGAISGATSLANTFANLNVTDQGQYVKGGSALNTFERIMTTSVTEGFIVATFYGMTAYKEDNYINFQTYGAAVQYTLPYTKANTDFMKALPNYPLLLSETNANSPEYYPYIAITAQIDGIPGEPATDIETQFNNGVRLKYVDYEKLTD